MHLSAAEHENELIFLYQLLPGAAVKSYGLWVAKLAGIPDKILDEATIILKALEENIMTIFSDLISSFSHSKK